MTEPVRRFFAKIKDEYGGEYPGAFVAVRKWGENLFRSGESADLQVNYVVESDLEAITYKVSYWYTEETLSLGKRSRPLLNEVDGSFTDIHNVNMDNPKVIEALNSDPGSIAATLLAIEIDVKQKGL
tara:strand:- start:334 stop:714 length:381 start_codon:yes stop_codon:yes gene_type:complete